MMMLRKRNSKSKAINEAPISGKRSALKSIELNSLGSNQPSLKKRKAINNIQKTKKSDVSNTLLTWLKTAKPGPKKSIPDVLKPVDPYDIEKEYSEEIRSSKKKKGHSTRTRNLTKPKQVTGKQKRTRTRVNKNHSNTCSATTNIIVPESLPVRSPLNDVTLSENQLGFTQLENVLNVSVEGTSNVLTTGTPISDECSSLEYLDKIEEANTKSSNLDMTNQYNSEIFLSPPARPFRKISNQLPQDCLTPITPRNGFTNTNTMVTSTPIVAVNNVTRNIMNRIIQPYRPVMNQEASDNEIKCFQQCNRKTYSGRVCVINKTKRRKRDKKNYCEYSSDDEMTESIISKSDPKRVKHCKESKEFEEWALKMNLELVMAESFELAIENV